MPTSKETRVRVEGFWKIIASVRPGRRWCSSLLAWRCLRSSARSSTDSRSSRLQSATRVKLRPFRLSAVALIRAPILQVGTFEAGLVQQVAQAREAGEHAALDRPERLAEPLGELALGEAAVVAELERLALLRRQLRERLLDEPALEAERRLVLGRARVGRLRRALERLAAADVLAADEVDGAAVDEGQDPGARLGALGEEAVGVPPHAEEGLLHGILGEGRVAQDPQREPVRDATEAVVECGQGVLVGRGHEREQRLVGEAREVT